MYMCVYVCVCARVCVCVNFSSYNFKTNMNSNNAKHLPGISFWQLRLAKKTEVKYLGRATPELIIR